MTRTASVPLRPPASEPTGWRIEYFFSALSGAFPLSVFESMFDRMERRS